MGFDRGKKTKRPAENPSALGAVGHLWSDGEPGLLRRTGRDVCIFKKYVLHTYIYIYI